MALGLCLFSGCAFIYDVKSADEQRQCDRLTQMSERSACMQRLQQMNKEVARSRAEAATQAAPTASEPAKPNGLCFRRATTQELVCPN